MESRDAALSAEGVFPMIIIKIYMSLKFIQKKHLETINQIYFLFSLIWAVN